MKKALFIEPLMTLDEAAPWVTADELARAQGFLLERRRREFLTWCAIVRRELGLGMEIGYDAVGAPQIMDRNVHIGVAHCPGRVAVCISDAPCAVDIEPEVRDFSRASSRYIASSEHLLSDHALLPAVVWCTKEALYKYSGREGLDFLLDLHVEAVDFEAGYVIGRIKGEAPHRLTIDRREGFITVYIL
ncbi:siderophore synthetase phosphopantetheinyl transferase subunit [uncultured Alistipes sp.]|jgi:phosphopantetheinyl transferase component of siderophore synthetase|uniref:4'-phosphopantetheinyl transferase family protein n=1 Tax=uncultured Alistipes sp. TaxID=538949 RepID=UPI0025D5B852|nr:siderophore synthetase phosphopantetheinyl transferase subunit [uncultured Alistipes sp.]